jgi:hypothetical protein
MFIALQWFAMKFFLEKSHLKVIKGFDFLIVKSGIPP